MTIRRIFSANQSKEDGVIFEDENYVFFLETKQVGDTDLQLYSISNKENSKYHPFIDINVEDNKPTSIFVNCSGDYWKDESVSDFVKGIDDAVIFAKKVSDYLNIPISNL